MSIICQTTMHPSVPNRAVDLKHCLRKCSSLSGTRKHTPKATSNLSQCTQMCHHLLIATTCSSMHWVQGTLTLLPRSPTALLTIAHADNCGILQQCQPWFLCTRKRFAILATVTQSQPHVISIELQPLNPKPRNDL